MSSITSNVGLASGLPTGDIINQLMAIEARPRTSVQERIGYLTAQKTAFLSINARLLALKTASGSMGSEGLFDTKRAAVSDESVLAASASKSAVEGTYNFTVDSLVTTHQVMTNGFNDADTQTLGATTLTFDSHKARLDRDPRLDDLNGQDGVQRGTIRIVDRSGAVEDIDLSRAVYLSDVVSAINDATTVNVTASLDGDNLVLTDNTSQTTVDLQVFDLGSRTTAADLGIIGNSSSTDTITGTQLNAIKRTTSLGHLNDGLGVRLQSGDDLTIADRDGTSFNVMLDGTLVGGGPGGEDLIVQVVTLGDLIDAINTAASDAGSQLTAAIASDGLSLTLTDAGGGGSNILVTDNTTAQDLGLSTAEAGTTINGEKIVAAVGSVLLKNLNGGSGANLVDPAYSASVFDPNKTPGELAPETLLADLFGGAGIALDPADDEFMIQVHETSGFDGVDLDGAVTVQDLIDAVTASVDSTSFPTGGAITVSVEAGNILRFTDNTSGGENKDFRILDAGTSSWATALGIAGNYTTGSTADSSDVAPSKGAYGGVIGTDYGPGSITVATHDGSSTTIDLTTASSVSEVVSLINANTDVDITATLNDAGNGLVITDNTTGSNNLVIQDFGGNLATVLGIVTDMAGTADSTTGGSDLDMKYLSETTRLDTLNANRGVTTGKFIIMDSMGGTNKITINDNDTTLSDVIAKINTGAVNITASINSTGDGILLTDIGGGGALMTITEDGSSTGASLGLIGAAAVGETTFDGSFERTVEIESTDTLDDVADKINSANVGISASVLNDGSGSNAYRMTLASEYSGVAGRMLFDDGGLGLNTSNLVAGNDAVVFFGSSNPADALLITSEENALNDTISGVTIDLLTTSDSAVELTVSRDDSAVSTLLTTLVASFNAVVKQIDQHDSYNIDTEVRGILLGDSTVGNIRQSLFRMINSPVKGVSGQFTYLHQVGLKLGSGAVLELDEDKFRSAMAKDHEAVRELFTSTTLVSAASTVDLPDGITLPSATAKTVEAVGFGNLLEELMDRVTDDFDGTLTLKTESLDRQVELANKRIEQLNKLLESKRERLEAKFANLELVLADMQSQASSLNSIQGLG